MVVPNLGAALIVLRIKACKLVLEVAVDNDNRHPRGDPDGAQ